MQVNNNSVEFCIDILTTRIAEEIARQRNIPEEEAIRTFMATKTNALLIDKESHLYLESFEYIMDMFAAEENGNWSQWLEV